MAHFSVCLKSFDRNHIHRAIRQLQTALAIVAPTSPPLETAKEGSATLAEIQDKPKLPPLLHKHPKGIVSLPTRRSRYTVLSGPHIDKKSREQFEVVREKTRINFELESGRAEVFYELLKNMYLGGVQLSVRVRTNTYLP